MFVIYNIHTTKLLHNHVGARKASEWYKTVSAAKAAITRALKKTVSDGHIGIALSTSDFAIADRDEFFNTIEKKEKRQGIVHAKGTEFEVGVNTPWTSGPWSETYFAS